METANIHNAESTDTADAGIPKVEGDATIEVPDAESSKIQDVQTVEHEKAKNAINQLLGLMRFPESVNRFGTTFSRI